MWFTRWHEEALISRIKATKAALAVERAPVVGVPGFDDGRQLPAPTGDA